MYILFWNMKEQYKSDSACCCILGQSCQITALTKTMYTWIYIIIDINVSLKLDHLLLWSVQHLHTIHLKEL